MRPCNPVATRPVLEARSRNGAVPARSRMGAKLMGIRRNIAALVAVSVLTSTAEGRAQARERLKRHNRTLWIIAAILWLPLGWAIVEVWYTSAMR